MNVDRVAKLPLFGELDHYDLEHVASWLRDVELEPGTVLITQGAMPDDVFVIEEESVEVMRDGTAIAMLGAGDVVGEIALLQPQRRTATVRATSVVRAVALNLRDLPQMASEMPEIVRHLRSIAERRLAELT